MYSRRRRLKLKLTAQKFLTMKGILTILFAGLGFAHAQTLSPKVISTGGGVASNGGYSLTYTTGETIIATLQSGSRLLSEGFQQPQNFGVLPVTLIDFNASRTDKKTVLLQWNTATEADNSGFEIQRRDAAQTVFLKRGFTASLAPGGNSSTILHYTFNDNNSYSGTSYYRLQQTDANGKSSLTVIKAVNGSSNAEVSLVIFPNPSKGSFRILIHGFDEGAVASVTDMAGRTIRQVTLVNDDGVMVTGLKTGTYIIAIPDAFGKSRSFSQKLVVQQ